MQRCGGAGRQCTETASKDRGKRWRHGCGEKYRGKLASVVRAYVTDMEDELRLARPERVLSHIQVVTGLL